MAIPTAITKWIGHLAVERPFGAIVLFCASWMMRCRQVNYSVEAVAFTLYIHRMLRKKINCTRPAVHFWTEDSLQSAHNARQVVNTITNHTASFRSNFSLRLFILAIFRNDSVWTRSVLLSANTSPKPSFFNLVIVCNCVCFLHSAQVTSIQMWGAQNTQQDGAMKDL